MPVILDEFSEKERLLRLFKQNIEQIRKTNPDLANFEPNCMFAFLVHPQGNLRSHLNKNEGNSPYVAVWSYGCTLKYFLEYPKDIIKEKKDMDNSDIEYNACNFNLKSQDFLIFDGCHVKHGYKICYDWTFSSEKKIQLYLGKYGITEPYRLGIVLMRIDKPEKNLLPYFYHGKAQHDPLYPKKFSLQ